MLFLTISALSALALVNYRIGGKALFYPPVVLCSVWAADLVLVWIAGGFFYPLSPETLLIFCVDSLHILLGHGWCFYGHRETPRRSILFQNHPIGFSICWCS